MSNQMEVTAKYWYYNNWNGKKNEFDGLPAAIKAAKEEDGVSITIYNEDGIVKLVQCNGYCYP